jgi:hypothetical protein
LIFGWGGNGFGNNGQAVTEAQLCSSMNFNNLENAVGRMSDNQQTQFTQLNNGLCQIGYQNLQNATAIQNQISECCCTTHRGIDNVNYNNALNTAQINANVTAQIQSIKDILCQNKQEAMQAEIQQLQLQNALAGVVRYPNGFVYNAGTNPFCNGGCNCNI